jgi:hypothetical protein
VTSRSAANYDDDDYDDGEKKFGYLMMMKK